MGEGFGPGEFEDQVEALEGTMAQAAVVAAVFKQEMDLIQVTIADTAREVKQLRTGFSTGLRQAIDGLIFDGGKLSDTLRDLGRSMTDAVYAGAMRPITDHIGGILAGGVGAIMSGLIPFEKGGSFVQGRVMPFAQGGVVSGPISFPMRGGMGLIGESGPEAILPLSRGTDGQLGVQTAGGSRPVNIVINIATPDVEGFRRSQSQIAAHLTRALGRGQRNR